MKSYKVSASGVAVQLQENGTIRRRNLTGT